MCYMKVSQSPGGGSQAHSEGGVALHRRHGRQELDLRGRREEARGGIEGAAPSGLPFIALVESAVSGSRPSNPPSMAKWAPRDRQGPPSIPATCPDRLHDGSRAVKEKSGGH